ncbi:c-type cytochrome [Luteolibacter pohnpeiensis]|uniref:C-type cytochrome n=1 Tax=Luteolibacter pohnpeiensis TaxID=454153 RepID=A0A934S6J2_9BACT|nr:cbb3-type cytochrome c oxidase N-terminal domain-containing protein [Luteolibacter pohnpeiensis]MBK1882104.1 c-type cytochrome [Luteolibacter pohnpeiensis]
MSDTSPEDKQVRRGNYAQSKNEIVLREHEYDGIQEFDQKLPNWWLFTLYIAIGWTVVHWCIYYYTNSIQTDQQRVQAEIVSVEQQKAKALEETLRTLNDETMLTKWVPDPAVIAAGETTFTANCVACHGADLSATMTVDGKSYPLPGLSLVDGQWKYGSKPMDLFKLINEGTPADSEGHNGARMQAWGQVFSPKTVAEVTAYVISRNPKDFGLSE